MGAFWDAWNKQGQVNDQAAMAQIQQAAGLAGLMQQANAVKAQEAAKGILASDAPDEVKIKGLMSLGGPGIQIANQLAVMQEHQQKVSKEKRVNDFWTKEAPKFNTPEQPELRSQALPGGMMGPAPEGQGGILQPYKPAGVDFEGLLNRGAQVGAVNPEALVNHRAQQAERAAAREDRMNALKLQIAERVQRGQDAADLRRDLAEQAAQARQDAIRLAASLRIPPQPSALVQIDDGQGGVKWATRDEAVGKSAPAPAGERKDAAKLVREMPTAKLRLSLATQNLDRLDSAIKELDDAPGLSNITGPVAGRTPNLSGDATNAQAKLNSIRSQVFVNALQAMRDASKTGGAVGSVSNREGDKLESTLAALDQAQTTEEFRNQLKKARAQVRMTKELLQSAFEEQYSGVQQAPPSGIEDRLKRYK